MSIDEKRFEEGITERTKAIFLVHYAGVGCEMEAIMAAARWHGLAVVEDNTRGLTGNIAAAISATFGELAALSFHETKTFTCGEGGTHAAPSDSARVRAELSYVLFDPTVARSSLGVDLAFVATRDFRGLPLSSAASFPDGRTFGGREGDCPVTEHVAERLLRLPFYTGMTDSEQTQVIDAVRAFRC